MSGTGSGERRVRLEDPDEGAGADVEEEGCGSDAALQEFAAGVEAHDGWRDAAGGVGRVDFLALGVEGEGVADGGLEGERSDGFSIKRVARDGAAVGVEDEQVILGGVVGERGGGGDAFERKGAEGFAEAGGLGEARGVSLEEKDVAVARPDGEIAAGGEAWNFEFAFDGSGGAIDDADLVSRGEAEEEVIGEGIVGEAEEEVARFEEGGDFGGGGLAAIVDGLGR